MSQKFQTPDDDKFIKKILFAIIILILIIVLGTYVAQKASPDETISSSLYHTIALITHVNIDELGNNYLFLMVSLLGYVTQFYILYVILEFVLEGKLRNIFSEVKVLNKIKHMKGHYIICGGGRVGKNVAKEMQKYKKHYVIIESDKNKVDKLRDKGIIAFTGDALDDKDLTKAGIENAKYLVASLGDDGDNILLVLTAKEIKSNIIIASRASDEKLIKKLKHAGANFIILPEFLGGQQLAHSLIRHEHGKA